MNDLNLLSAEEICHLFLIIFGGLFPAPGHEKGKETLDSYLPYVQ